MKRLRVNDSDSDFKASYNQFSKAFREMHDDTFDAFNIISLQRKIISKLEREV